MQILFRFLLSLSFLYDVNRGLNRVAITDNED